MLGGVDHVGGDDQVIVPGLEALIGGRLLQVELAVFDEGKLGEFFFGAAAENRRNVSEAIIHLGHVLEHGQQPGGGAAGTAADFQDAQRASLGLLMFTHQSRDHTGGYLIEIAPKAELLVQHLDAAGRALREDHRHRFNRAVHHRAQLFARPLHGVGDHVQAFAAGPQGVQQCRALGHRYRAGAVIEAVVVTVVAVLHAGVEQAHQQLSIAR